MEVHKIIKKMTVAMVATTTFATGAAAQEACNPYTVKQGDSLASIANTAYGTFDYQMIFNANRVALGKNPNELDAGLVLNLPCEDGRISSDAEFDTIVKEQEKISSAQGISNVYAPDIKMLSGNGWKPFTDESLSGGGAFVRLASTALNRANNNRGYKVDWIDDWGSHLNTLLPSGAYDIAIAWYLPDCAKNPDLMGENSLYRCNSFYHSVPVYETVIGYYSRPDSEYANARTMQDYAGAKVCRVEGWFTSDLEEGGLVEPVVEMVRPKTVEACFEAVASGEADVTGLSIQVGASFLGEPEFEGKVVQNATITNLLSARFFTHKSNPFGLQYITMMNNGLNEMRKTGEWYDVISSSLAEHNLKTQ
jgi:hypothetical protein